MDSAYDKKFAEMKKYIPFLENMIKRLENTGSTTVNPRQAQLDKIRSLRDLLLDKKKRMKMDNLLKCEQVLINLYAKVEQKDTLNEPAVKVSAVAKDTTSKEKSELETVRNKLKTVARLQDCSETLPEIARANDIEFQYTGNKEPALFQRRPNKSSKSPTNTAQISPIDSKTISLQNQQKRNYTRVLVSPDQSPRRWSSSERSSSDKPLFSRRSPPPKQMSPPPITRKEKKKSKMSKSRKTKNVNITLNVPQESLNSLSAEDILPRILNCKDGDVDIETLRELRSQILGELKQSGNNEDISNLILQSYKKSKSKKNLRNKNKEDVEEGELSDSESEAIDSIYGSLSVVDKNKKSLNQMKNIEDKDNQQRKIQISLVINTDKETSTGTESTNKRPPIIDLSEFEMFSENESDKSKDIISVDSDSSPTKKDPINNSKKSIETSKARKKVEVLPIVKKSNMQSGNVTECITVDDDIEDGNIQDTEVLNVDDTKEPPLDNPKTDSFVIKQTPDTTQADVPAQLSPVTVTSNVEIDSVPNKNQERGNIEERPKFIANFYKPLEDQPLVSPDTSCSITHNLPGTSSQNTSDNKDIVQPATTSTNDNILNENENAVQKKTYAEITATEPELIRKDTQNESQTIPLLDEATDPPKAKTDMLSEIDILQALKNEILNETISIPGAEITTPALHQPKLIKVSNAQEVMPIKRITIENYMEKAPIRKKKRKGPKIFIYREGGNKKQSLKLTDKECERFQFPKRLSLDDEDDDAVDIYDDDLQTEDKDESVTLDHIYADLAPKSPDVEIICDSVTPPVIIPTDPVKAVINPKNDVDMRKALLTTPTLSSLPQAAPPLHKMSVVYGNVMPSSPAYGVDRNLSEKTVSDKNRINTMDPRIRRDTTISAVNSPNPYLAVNPERTPRSTSFANLVSNAPNMTPSRLPSMTPSMTPSYMPSVPQIMTPNARMTPSHQTFELDESSSRKHVYAPSFSMCDNRERESSVSRDGSPWEVNNSETRNRRSRWEESNIPTGGPKWDKRDPRSVSSLNDGSRTPRYEDSYVPKYDKYSDHSRGDKYNQGRRDTLYSRTDCPMTPVPSFGWSECPSTPTNAFGRQEAPMTPSHPFGRSDCPTTPIHSFGRADCPSTPSSGFGRNVDNASHHSFVRSDCPSTPIHSFGRSECPSTPSHSFGRSDCPLTPSHPFGRSESTPYGRPDGSNNSNQKYSKDPRLNRRPNEYETNSHPNERDYPSERGRKDFSFSSQNRHYTSSDRPRNYERERSVGRNDKNYGDRNSHQYDRDRHNTSVGRSMSKDYENDRFYSRNRGGRYDARNSNNYDEYTDKHNQRESSVSRTSNTKEAADRHRSTSRAVSVGRNTGSENKDNISFQSDTGRQFTINTSIKSTFQDIQTGQPIKYPFDARRQRAASVGRSLVRENSISRTLPPVSTKISTYSKDRNEKFKRACSVGREPLNTSRSLKEVKADFEAFKANLKFKKFDTSDTPIKDRKSQVSPRSKKDSNSTQHDRKNPSKQQYSPRKNSRDPRVRKEVDIKTRYKIDKRNDPHKQPKSGIVYSTDNIARGTIMGSGLGVKNYKIPKIKRPEPEPEPEPEVKAKEPSKKKTSEKETVDSFQKLDTNKKPEESDKNNKLKLSKEPSKIANNELLVKDKTKKVEKRDLKNVAVSEGRVTRSRKKSDTKESKEVSEDEDIVSRTRKLRKSVFRESDSDSEDEDKSKTKKLNSLPTSPMKTANNSKKSSSPNPVLDKELLKNHTEETLDSSFAIDDIFSDNLASDPVIENLNALIADLDHDLDTSKVSNESFTTEMEKMFDAIDSPENCLGDISEVIEKDLSESNDKLQKTIDGDFLMNQNISKKNKQDANSKACHGGSDLEISHEAGQKFNISTHTPVEKSIILDKSVSEPSIPKDIADNTTLLNVNDNIVSTTEIVTEAKESQNRVDTVNSDDQSVPDSTINKNVSGKTLPDSTNDELSSDVTSTNDNAETSNKESDLQNATPKEPFNQIGSLLSILQDKSKIKELLSMLGEQSNSDNEKIKKKLEKLSQIVSDEEDDDEEKSMDVQKEKNRNETENSNTEKNAISDKTDNKNLSEDVEEKLFFQKNDNNLRVPNTEVSIKTIDTIPDLDKTDKTSTIVGENLESVEECTSNIEETSNTTNEKPPDNKSPNESENTETYKEESPNLNLNTKTDTFDDSVKMGINNQSSEDDEPLVKKATKKTKGKKITKSARNKMTNKRTTRATLGKTGVKKRGELQKLQEDIKEMFMSDDILNATGIRMCRLAKMVNEKESADSEPVVVLEKFKGVENLDQPVKVRKKPGPKPKVKATENISVSQEGEKKMNKPKTCPKNRPGPKSKTKSEDTDPYEFDTDSIADTNTTKESDDDSSDTETGSLASSRSFGSSEVLSDTKKKPKRKRRGIGGWQSGIIKPRKRKEPKTDSIKLDPPVKPQRSVTIPDLNCFTDKAYCFQKGVKTYDCRLCVYTGTEIVSHYKKQHPHTEIPLSRMDQKTAELAISQCEQKNYLALSKVSTDKYVCRFCHQEFSNNHNVLEMFFWHVVSNHTGEFKHLCPECINVTRCPFNLDIPPTPKDGGQLIGYICKKCNFTQISLKNLKTHVIEHHSDEQTEVFTINLAVMSNKAMKAMLRRAQLNKPRVVRSLRSNQSAVDTSDVRNDRSDDDASESSPLNSECDTSQAPTRSSEELKSEVSIQKPEIDKIKAKLTFENDEPSDDTSVKMEQDDNDGNDHEESSQFDDTQNIGTTDLSRQDSRNGISDQIMDYAHFKLNYTSTGAKEYVCCINGNDNHYKTSLLISMKKHIQSKHSEKWDGYCCLCKVLVTLQGVQSDFKDCLSHFLDKHMDDFPVLVQERTSQMEVTNIPESNLPAPVVPTIVSAVPAISSAIPARVATPPVERTASPSYIAVRPIAELLSRELIREIETPLQIETPIALPKIDCVVSLGEGALPAQPSPVYPSTAEPITPLEKPFLYEEVQAEVMSKKHRVVLDAMMSKENLVRVFKCAGRFCSFTTDSVDDALLHATAHQRVGGEGALMCAYCNYDACDNGIDLVMHVFKEHNCCPYCCPACFYRAAASQLVDVHYQKAHGSALPLKSVLRSTAASASVGSGPSTSLLPRDVAVPHYVCNHGEGTCVFKTYISRKFVEHMQQKHPNATSHPCNLCPAAPLSPAELVFHLRAHGLKLYQCTWCIHGASNESELLAHVAAKHPGRQPQAYVRIITQRDGGQRVLPLANLNKSNVSIEDVVPSATKENPVKEAERSIDLEKLIGHTMMITEVSTNQTTEDTPTEEPVEIPTENLLEEHDNDEPNALETLLATTIPSEKGPEPILQSEISSTPEESPEKTAVKTEPEEVVRNLSSTDVICLDSDEETDSVMEKAVTATDDASKSVEQDEVTAKVSTDVSRSSVTDEVSITKITEDITKKSSESEQITEKKQVQHIIDLSDDEPSLVQTTDLSATTKTEMIKDKAHLYKCPGCYQICKSAYTLKLHVNGNCKVPVHTNIKCPHSPCAAVLTNLAKLLAHYLKEHRALTVNHFCGICTSSFSSLSGAKLHIRAVHKVTNYDVTIAKNADGTTRVTVREKPSERVRASARKTSTEIQRYTDEPAPSRPRKTSTEARKSYGIADIDKLPISPILDAAVYCELCEFGTKVRLNMVRHLQQHAERVPVPRTAPVNPVPHLETNEMHFDKMVNLASSSVASRARLDEPAVAVRVPPAECSRYPRYVPERLRYTCGARACSYISVDQAMFRCHWDTLHAAELEYCCVHCPPNQALDTSIPLSAPRIIAHLRMHDVSLYACSTCSYYHYKRHMVDKHISDAHGEGAVKVVREECQPESAAPAPAAGEPTMDLKPWQCGLCSFSSMLRPNVVSHCGAMHQSKMQFKCAYCPFRTSAKENVVKHQTNAHPTKPEDLFYYFYREGSLPAEPDGVPRWRKQRQSLGLDEVLKTEPEPEPTEAPPTDTVPPAKSDTTPLTVDLNIVKEEIPEEPSSDTELSLEELCKKYGEFCEPDGIKYKCCLCNVVREHARDIMQGHLYEELNYRRWECVICLYKAFHKTGLNDHMASEHSRQYTQPRTLPTDVSIEKWVQAFLDHQSKAIESNLRNLNVQKIQGERVTLTPAPKEPEEPKPTSTASDSELENAFGEFGAPKNQKYACPKCDFVTKDEGAMVTHLESELSKIRWGCTNCTGKYTTFHEAQFHCKSAHTPPSRPKEAIRDPSLRSGWVKAVVASQKQFIKCISSNRELSPDRDCEQTENSLLVALYDEPVHIDERTVPTKRPAPAADSDDERLVIDEPPTKKINDRQCPYCDYAVNNTRYLREHILVQHYNLKPYRCSYCPFEGTRRSVYNHLNVHFDRPKQFITVQVPTWLPEGVSKKPKRELSEPESIARTSKRDAEEVTKKVCLYCEKSVPENEIESHTHGAEKAEFAKRGEVVVKCCKCLVLRLSVTSLQDHFDACHPGEKVLDNYAYFKLQVDTREIYCCGHCYKKFKFIRDLKAHHMATHTSLSLSYTSIPFSHNLHTEGDSECGKRRLEDTAGPSTKRVARKSTSKLPNSAVAKKSTTKLPHTLTNQEYSFYGKKPAPLSYYKDLTVSVPMYDSIVELNMNKVAKEMNIDPKVIITDYKS